MAALTIQTGADNPILRKKTELIPKVTKDILKMLKDMKDTMKEEGGIGIAAPQVGYSLRMCWSTFNGKCTAMINPEITWKGKETDIVEEGCLSLPGIDVKVERPTEITVRYLDIKGNEQERKLNGYDARVIQHEVDHLDNVLIVDYQNPLTQP
ncbi:MAG: peptide deformylase [Kiritimatiellales bacterium]|nr:peptide deformylase [Kiritimatiellales bacterium]